MRAGAIAIAMALILAGCGGGSGDERTVAESATTGVTAGGITAKLPPGAVAPAEPGEDADEGAGAEEASPEAGAVGPSTSGELPIADQGVVRLLIDAYVAALNKHQLGRVCALLADGCPGRPTIGAAPRGGGPAWRKTSVHAIKVERLTDDRARATATVTHHFSDRKYASVEDDVIYLERRGAHYPWEIAKPSATFYRATGYAEPPLRAFAPPAGW